MAQLKKQYELTTTLQSQSAEILAALEAHPAFRAASIVLLYYSLKDEVDTHEFVRKWSREKLVLLPVVKGEELEAYGIGEPTGELFTDYAAIDFAVIPGVAFDATGNRLGRGKGYYDRLLPRLTAFKAGICFPFQLVEEVPAEPFDIRMDTIISIK